MKSFEQAVKILEKVEKVIGHGMITIHFFSDESGAVMDRNNLDDIYLFEFRNFEEIEANFITWQEDREEKEPIYVGGCG